MTSLGNGRRVPKTDARVEALGAVDELNSLLGVATLAWPRAWWPTARALQQDLFDLGADLAMGKASGRRPALTLDHAARLEALIEREQRRLPVLNSFVLPTGTSAAAWCHLARAVSRRAERRVAAAAGAGVLLVYLNRLSDFLFVLARTLNRRGTGDVLWNPARARRAPKR